MYVHVYRAGIKLASFRLKTHYCLSPSRDIPTWNKEWSRKKTSTGRKMYEASELMLGLSSAARPIFR